MSADPAQNAKQPRVFEDNYQRHSALPEKAKLEYKELYRQMASKLSTSDLEPFVKVMAECEQMAVENKEEIIETVRKLFLKEMEAALDAFWKNCDVANGLISLEMLKEKFKEFEGMNWNLAGMSPEERTLPMRMHLKQMQVRHLQKQLQFQKALLAEKMNEVTEQRNLIQHVEAKRILLKKKMEQQVELFSTTKPQLLQMQMELLNLGAHGNETAPSEVP